jgi:TrmH family RNA methyltransferase
VTGSFQGDVIRSADNATLKSIRSLRKRSVRESERAFVVEGVRAVTDAIDAGGQVRTVLVRAGEENAFASYSPGRDVRSVESKLFNRLSETEHPQPVIAVFDLPYREIVESGPLLYLIADGVKDPGNLGTLLRSAAAAGVTAVLLAPETVDPFNGKVVRAGMGAHFRVPLRLLDENWIDRVAATCVVRIVADARAELTYDQVDWRASSALVIGSEAHGKSAATSGLGTTTARIPLSNGVESLNAGVAGSIILFEALRQRSG